MALSDPFSPGVHFESGRAFGDEPDTEDEKPAEINKITPQQRKRNTTFGAEKEKVRFPRLSHNPGKENPPKRAPSARAKGSSSSEKGKSLKGRALKSLSVSVPNSEASSPRPPKKATADPFKIFTTEGSGDKLNKESDDASSGTEKGCPSCPSPEYDPPSGFSLAETRGLTRAKESPSGIDVEKFRTKHGRKSSSRSPRHEQMKEDENDPLFENSGKMLEIEKLRLSYKRRLTLDKLLKIVRDPWMYFSDKERDCSGYSDHSLHYLKTTFRKHYNQIISDALLFHNNNLYLAYKYLTKKNRGLKLRASNRALSECTANRPDSVNPQFLLEVMFIESEEDVKTYMRNVRVAKNLRLRDAKRFDHLARCERCFEQDLLGEDVILCNKGHSFCKKCIAKYFESGIAKESFSLKCLSICEEKYSLATLQDLLDIENFSKLAEMCEIFEPDDIPGLVRCPFCKCYGIETEKDNSIMCLNPKCLLIYCRECKELDHEPKKCEEINSEEVKLDIFQLKESDRKCWKCEGEVAKEEGCNEMMCPCGGRTCYACKSPVEGNSHFFLYEDEDGSKCPLYATDFRTEPDLF